MRAQAPIVEAGEPSLSGDAVLDLDGPPTGHLIVDDEPMAYWLPPDVTPASLRLRPHRASIQLDQQNSTEQP